MPYRHGQYLYDASRQVSAVSTQHATRQAIIVLMLVCLAVVGSLATWFSAAAILPELAREWQLSPAILPWMTNAVQIGFVLGALGASLFNIPDRVPLNRLMAGSALLAALSNLLLLLDPGPAAIGLRLVTGIALAGVYPSAIKLMATWFERGRGIVLGLLIGSLTLGSSLPHLVRAGLGQFDWRAVVIATSLSSLAGAVVFLLVAREGPSPFARGAKFNLRAIGAILRDKPVFLANLGYFGHMWELYAMWGWFLAFSNAASQVHMPGLQSGASLLTFCVVAAGVPGCIAGGLLSDRIGRTLTCSILMALSAVCALTIGLAFDGPVWLFASIALIWGFSIVGDSAQFSAAVTELSDRSYVGTALALQMGLGFGVTVIAIWLTPILAGWVGWRWVFLFLAPGPLVGIAAMLTLRRLPQAARLANGRR